MKFRYIAFLLSVTTMLGAAPIRENPATVVATTSWTAAFALAAGVENVTVLAPYELRHPAEYELSPGDLATISGAKYLIFAGYEGMMPRIREAIGSTGPELLQIATDFGPGTIEESIGKIAAALGSSDAGRRSVEEILGFYGEWKEELADAGLAGVPVVTHAFHAPLANALGARVVGTFGPAPLEARQIAELSALPARLVIDNYHNDVGKPLLETMDGVPVVTFINFPGYAGTITLMDVLRENRRRLSELSR